MLRSRIATVSIQDHHSRAQPNPKPVSSSQSLETAIRSRGELALERERGEGGREGAKDGEKATTHFPFAHAACQR